MFSYLICVHGNHAGVNSIQLVVGKNKLIAVVASRYLTLWFTSFSFLLLAFIVGSKWSRNDEWDREILGFDFLCHTAYMIFDTIKSKSTTNKTFIFLFFTNRFLSFQSPNLKWIEMFRQHKSKHWLQFICIWLHVFSHLLLSLSPTMWMCRHTCTEHKIIMSHFIFVIFFHTLVWVIEYIQMTKTMASWINNNNHDWGEHVKYTLFKRNWHFFNDEWLEWQCNQW